MSSLSLGKATSLQQEKDAQAQRPMYNVQAAHPQAPLAAPQPQRAPAPGVWTPDMPIAFSAPTGGAPAVPSLQKGKSDGRWEPSAGLKFS
jgi:hypothetical protein